MAEYIKREQVLDFFNKIKFVKNSDVMDGVQLVLSYVENEIPAADVVEHKCGVWIYDSDNIPICSECEEPAFQRLNYNIKSKIFNLDMVQSNYCPNCGAHLKT